MPRKMTSREWWSTWSFGETICLLIILTGVFLYLGPRIGDQHTARPKPPPLPAGPPPITWTFLGDTCGDGWPSTSIGERGACSHHGGVASEWKGSDGRIVRCTRSYPPISSTVQEQQLRQFGQIIC